MSKIVLILFGLLTGASGFAQSVFYDDSAVRICRGLSMSFDVDKCMGQIKNNKYDPKVIGICASMALSYERIECLREVANQYFLNATELQICRDKNFGFEKRQCLANSSKVPFNQSPGPGPALTLGYIDDRLAEAIRAVQKRDGSRAESILQRLRNKIQDQIGSRQTDSQSR